MSWATASMGSGSGSVTVTVSPPESFRLLAGALPLTSTCPSPMSRWAAERVSSGTAPARKASSRWPAASLPVRRVIGSAIAAPFLSAPRLPLPGGMGRTLSSSSR